MHLFGVIEEISQAFYFIFQNSNVLDISQFQWLIPAEG